MADKTPKPDIPADQQEEAVRKEAASNPQSDTIDNRQAVDTDPGTATDPDRLQGGPAPRPSVPDEFAGVVEPETDPNKTTKY